MTAEELQEDIASRRTGGQQVFVGHTGQILMGYLSLKNSLMSSNSFLHISHLKNMPLSSTRPQLTVIMLLKLFVKLEMPVSEMRHQQICTSS